jgi:branched-chain amino acid transport system substrate-binding protein
VQKIWPPLGTKDFGPYIPTIKERSTRSLRLMVGPMSLQFPKQLRAAGYKKPIIGGGTSYDEFILPSMGDEVIGDVSALHVQRRRSTRRRTRAFVKKYRAKYGKVPSYYSEANYTTAQWIDEVMKKHGGKYPGPRSSSRPCGHQARRAARAGALDDAATGAQHLHQEGREEEDVRLRQGRALEHGDQDLSERQPVLDLRQGAFLKQPVYSARLPAVQYAVRGRSNPNLSGASHYHRGKELRSFPACLSEAAAISRGANYLSPLQPHCSRGSRYRLDS